MYNVNVVYTVFAGSGGVCFIWMQQTRREGVGNIQQKAQKTAQCQGFERQSKTDSVVACSEENSHIAF